MNKRIEIVCSQEIKTIFVTALRNYTDLTFPRGSADCSLVAREALLDTLADFEREYAASAAGRASYNRRLRAMVKEGLRLHYRLESATRGVPMEAECGLMLEVAEGIPRDDADLAAARRCDQAQSAATGNRK